MMWEETLIRHCSPTLAGLKTGNMFSCDFSSKEELYAEIRELNRKFQKKGLRILPLRYEGKRAMIYVYRPEKLKKDFDCCQVCQILNEQGYAGMNQNQCLAELIRRLNRKKDFPHEIGIFLGYPPEDVAGFMQNLPCQCVGYWKVYHHAEQAEQIFQQYRRCTEIFLKAYHHGRTLEKLIF